jgi:hypothetical protein
VTARDVLQAALALPEAERAMLVQELEASLHKDDDDFVAVIQERVRRVEAGEPGLPGEQVFDELLAR